MIYKRKRNSVFISNESIVQIGSRQVGIWIAIEPVHKCSWYSHF